MPQKLTITGFHEVIEPITELETKFGGQPVWLENPMYPVNPVTQEPIPFLCQIKLEPKIFGQIEAKMAYIFFDTGESIDWDNWAVVFQPGEYEILDGNGNKLEHNHLTGNQLPEQIRKEFKVKLSFDSDKDFVVEDQRLEWSFEEFQDFQQQFFGQKIGGTPALYVDWMAPNSDLTDWNLLLQIDANSDAGFPLEIDGLSDNGLLWFYISKNGRQIYHSVGESEY
jgi:uncharacterized protein YwqG